MKNIRQLMDTWARWRLYRHTGGFGKTVMASLLDGMPTTRCPVCSGKGKTRLYPICPTCSGQGKVQLKPSNPRVATTRCHTCELGEIKGKTCHVCHGSGKLFKTRYIMNPAFIPSTRQSVDDPTSEKIDLLVCKLSRSGKTLYVVIDSEFCRNRGETQEEAAIRLGIGYAAYRKRLERALSWIAKNLENKSRNTLQKQMSQTYT
jgi:RecJ-like exonuclease